jgi:hypothetical protein
MKKKPLPNSINEYANYTSSPRASVNTDPLNWWIENQKSYPILSKIAGDYLASQPSSTSSERTFKVSDDFITLDRSNLSQEKASKLVQLWSWNKSSF